MLGCIIMMDKLKGTSVILLKNPYSKNIINGIAHVNCKWFMATQITDVSYK